MGEKQRFYPVSDSVESVSVSVSVRVMKITTTKQKIKNVVVVDGLSTRK
jgi:hypothetical protein